MKIFKRMLQGFNTCITENNACLGRFLSLKYSLENFFSLKKNWVHVKVNLISL